MANWRAWARVAGDFLRGEAVSAAFHAVLPWVLAGMTALTFLVWGLLKGPAGPWVFLGTVVLFALVAVTVALIQAVRMTQAAHQRTVVMSETAQIPIEEKGLLDFGAGVEEALAEHHIVLPALTNDMKRFATIAEDAGQRVQKIASSSFVRKRAVTIKISRRFDVRADGMERRVTRLEAATNVLAESFVGLLELTDDPDALREHHRNASQMVKVVPVALAGTEKFRDSLENVRRQRIQQHLSLAIARTRGIVVRIEAALVITSTTCEKVITIADAKLAQAKPPVSVTSP
jgi:hypothetical protein